MNAYCKKPSNVLKTTNFMLFNIIGKFIYLNYTKKANIIYFSIILYYWYFLTNPRNIR